MSSHSTLSAEESDVCARVKRLGYGKSKTIRLYGEEYVAVSDPFFEGGGVALRVTTKRDPCVQILRLPVTILQSVVGRSFVSAAQSEPVPHL